MEYVNRSQVNLVQVGKKKRKTGKSIFPLVSSLDNRGKSYSLDDCRYLVDNRPTESGEHADLPERHNLGFFMDRGAFLEMLDREENHHREEDNLDYTLQMKVWTGDIGEALREAEEKGQLDDWLVSLAPLASRSLWLEMCEKYSRQLASEGLHHKAALYLLACHKVYEAMNMLKEQGLYREAVSIAKSRLPHSDPVLQRLMLDWANKFKKEGNYEMAAKCYVSQSNYSQAAKSLAKRNSAECYRMAAYIMAKGGNVVECEGYVLSCVRLALINHEWDTAEQMVEEQIALKVMVNVCALHLLISLHNKLTICLEDSKKIEKPTPLYQILVQKKTFDIHLWRGYFSDDLESILDIIRELWIEKNFLPPNPDFILTQDYCRVITKLNSCKQQALTSKEMVYHLAVNITRRILQSSFKISKVLNLAHKLDLAFFYDVCRIVFPSDHVSIKKDSCASSSTVAQAFVPTSADQLHNTFIGVTVPSWLNHLLSEQNKVIIRNTKMNEETRMQKFGNLALYAFYSLALLKHLKDELEGFEIVKHSENDETNTCSLPDCEDTRETLVLLIVAIASHLLNPDFHETFCLKHELDASDIVAQAVANYKPTLPNSETTEDGSNTEVSEKMLVGFQEICKETSNSPFPNPMNSALECLELCEALLLKVKCNHIASKLEQIKEAIHKWLESF